MKIKNKEILEKNYYKIILFFLFMYSLAYKGEMLLYSLGILILVFFKIILEKKIKINIELFLFLIFIVLLYFISQIQSELNLLSNSICWLIMYLIGQEVIYKKTKKDEKIKILKNFLLSIGLGFFIHAFLTTYYGVIVANGRNFLDYWSRNEIAATQIGSWCSILAGTLPYFILSSRYKGIFYKIRNIMILGSIFLITSKLGSRTIFYIIILNLLYVFFKIAKNKKINLILNGIFLIFVGCYAYIKNFLSIKTTLQNTQLYLRIVVRRQANVLQNTRLYRQMYFFTNMDRAFFGGNFIYKEVGGFIHNFWLDIFDSFGFITFIFLFIFTVLTIKNFIKIYFNKELDDNFRILLTGIFVSLFIQLTVEPTFSYGFYNFVGVFFFLTGIINNLPKISKKYK